MFKSFVVAAALMAMPVASQAGIFISVGFAPPVLPVYVQPICPAPGYIWTPGYWAYSDLSGYYWVPGAWVLAPQPGYLWTPPYWGFANGVYGFHPGYWGLHVGFYGGVNYGYGYHGVGFVGGVWEGGVFRYNTAFSNVNVNVIHNTYNRTVVINNSSRVAYNGGPGGINARATPSEEAAARERHFEATSAQAQHEHAAASNRQQWASENHGRPAFAASARPGEFNRPAAASRPTPHAEVSHPAAQHANNAPHAEARPQSQGHPEAHQPAHSEARPQHAAKPEGQKGEKPEHK